MNIKQFILDKNLPKAEIAIILGSGLNDLPSKYEPIATIAFNEIPGMPKTRVKGHLNTMRICNINGKNVVFMQGRLHQYQGLTGDEMLVPYEFLQSLGVKTIVCTNATGSTNADIGVGSIVLIHDHINLAKNPLISISNTDRDKFVDMSDCYSKEINSKIKSIANRHKIAIFDGVYANFSGPSYETGAEIKLAKLMGADVVGMSGATENILINYLGMKTVCISVVSNMGTGMTNDHIEHKDVLEVVNKVCEPLRVIFEDLINVL